MVKDKYQGVLDLGQKFHIQNGDVKVDGDKLHVSGTAATPWQKDQMWDAIKAAGGENPSDIVADIKVADSSIYAKHTVEGGESLSKIAKQYYGDANKYNKIFQANTGLLSNPDVIHPGQELVIPNL